MGPVGRLIAVVLFIAVMVPSGLLARAWSRAADRRLVAGGSVELVPPSEAGAAVLTRQARHGRRVRQLGFVLGLVLAEVALLRLVVRPLAADGSDVPVDEALRTWTAHLVVAAASTVALLPLGALLLVAGVDLGDRVSDGVDLLPVALVAGGFSAVTAGLAVAWFLVTWLRPVRRPAPALAG